ncbi:MAG: response regulator [Gemmatimonadaceae bacterium]|jgi:DNA-binding NtrC family response regulator|nr:response regulator [Gemmatimonadaceae bacterium]
MDSRRVLLVDDEAGIRLALRKWFERNGWSVDEAGDGDSAVSFLAAQHAGYGLVICDVHLPDTNGVAIATRVEADWPELLTRFVFSTGDHVEFTPAQKTLRERTHILLKPFDFADLRTLVQMVTNTPASSGGAALHAPVSAPPAA